MEFVKKLFSGPQYREFWQKYDDIAFILLMSTEILDFMKQRQRAALEDIVLKTLSISNDIMRCYKACLRIEKLPLHILCDDTLEMIIYNAPSKETRRHLLSHIYSDFGHFKDVFDDNICPIISVPDQATVVDIETAVREHLQQYGLQDSTISDYPTFNPDGIRLDMLEYVVPLLELKNSQNETIRRGCNAAYCYAIFTLEQIEYLANIYDIDLGVLPNLYAPATTEDVPLVKYRTMQNTQRIEGIDRLLKMCMSPETVNNKKLRATIIRALAGGNLDADIQNTQYYREIKGKGQATQKTKKVIDELFKDVKFK